MTDTAGVAQPVILLVVGGDPSVPVRLGELMLEAGDYFAACLVFDAAAGMPHALMGMQMSFTVA